MNTTPSTERRPITEVVGEVAGAFIADLQRGYLDDRSSAVAALAQLRRGAGKVPQDVPELWGVSGTEELLNRQDWSEREKARAEAAHFLAVTLYALHQQSRVNQGMHRRGVELGTAVRRLMPDGDIDEPIRRRFVRLGTATTGDALAERLRGIVSLLRREEIPLDYGLLAGQLYQAQLPGGMRQVRQRWGRSFHSYRPNASSADTSTKDAPTDKDT
ncbi:hypothetical protein GCM10017673_54800 [Streptosporangium violaceochromogenes]|nr:hypothetical protein GCM10017673_54800 [Streptosporangium violaceochromogenes]